MKNQFSLFWSKGLFVLCVIALAIAGLTLAGCDNGTTGGGGSSGGEVTLAGYSRKAGGSASILRLQSVSASEPFADLVSDSTYNSSTYRSFPIDNQGKSVRQREVTVDAILQFEQDVSGYGDASEGYAGYLAHYSSYPSNASKTHDEGVYLVFDSRDPQKRYQVGYHHINLSISNSNLVFFEDLIALGNPISIFHVDSISGPTCWVISWIPEDSGGIVGTPF
jgi:hypothetical protein